MKTIVAGSRAITNRSCIKDFMLSCPWQISTVVCGCASGVDTLAADVARELGIPVSEYPAIWQVNGKRDLDAGRRRNVRMAENAQALIALWDGKSPGTWHMMQTAERYGLLMHTVCVPKQHWK